MTITTQKPLAHEVRTCEPRFWHHGPRFWHHGHFNSTNDGKPSDVTIAMPTSEEYRDGINKLRVKIDCPVLGCPQEQLAKELTELPSLRVDLADDAADAEQRASTKRKTVAEYLKERHREEMFKRWPQFEQDTQDQLSRMSAEIDSLIFKLFITNLIIAIAIVIGSISWVF